MRTLQLFFDSPVDSIPAGTAWYLTELHEARGKQELFTRQAPQRLKALREHAMIESAVSSNRIEGVEIERDRVRPVLVGRGRLRDRNEEELRGYKDVLARIHQDPMDTAVSEETIKAFHASVKGEIWDAGQYKEKNVDIIERHPDGRSRVRFQSVTAQQTPAQLRRLVELWQRCVRETPVNPLIALAACNLDLLCIHPFRDGNGRVSRLLLLLQCYHLGFEVGRYISLERIIEQSKESYYETLEGCSQGWHEAKHDPWPYINYLLSTLRSAYRELEQRLGQVREPKGAKTEAIQTAVRGWRGQFTVTQLEHQCPGVSRDLVRKVLKQLQRDGEVECVGRGPGARWQKLTGRSL